MKSRQILGVPVGAGTVAKLVLFPAALAGAAWLIIRAADWYAPLWQLWLLALLLVVAVLLVLPLGEAYAPDLVPAPSGRLPASDRVYSEVSRWENLLAGSGDLDRFHERVQPRLSRIAAERLHARHGIDLHADPQRAVAVLGPHLHAWLTQPLNRRLDRRQMEYIVDRIEEI